MQLHIRDDNQAFQSTGTRNRREAEGALATYIATKNRPTGPATPDQVTVSVVLRRYGEERGPLVKDAARIGDCITALPAITVARAIMAHDHPSGVAEPSAAEPPITKRLAEALALVDVHLINHFVVGDGEVCSFAERGWL